MIACLWCRSRFILYSPAAFDLTPGSSTLGVQMSKHATAHQKYTYRNEKKAQCKLNSPVFFDAYTTIAVIFFFMSFILVRLPTTTIFVCIVSVTRCLATIIRIYGSLCRRIMLWGRIILYFGFNLNLWCRNGLFLRRLLFGVSGLLAKFGQLLKL